MDISNTRKIVIDTETTGMNTQGGSVAIGHKIIEIGCVEIIGREITQNKFHQYLNPKRLIDKEAIDVHGITDEMVKNEPIFASISSDFFNFIKGATLIIHNAPFDMAFLEQELEQISISKSLIKDNCKIIDSLGVAKKMHPNKRNNLDALSKRYNIDNSKRVLHGALLDADLLARVYLAMTGGQNSFSFTKLKKEKTIQTNIQPQKTANYKVLTPDLEEEKKHQEFLNQVDKNSNIW